ncbi:MAG: DNA-deoxyinosine glycosylase [Burkholderiaceae bacterium]|nr:DNA-deoxyinosine glycosylase [Burkholderiaceae bacterium]
MRTGPGGAPACVGAVAPDPTPPLRGLPPVIAPHSRLLILGSFPGEASLAAGHYYAHPRNLFWPILGQVLGEPLDEWPFERRYETMLAAGLAIWDVWGACRREGSLDSAIRDAAANDFVRLHRLAPHLGAVLFNGQAAGRFEPRFRDAGYQTRVMPSTSPAYASMPRERKLESWREAIESLR